MGAHTWCSKDPWIYGLSLFRHPAVVGATLLYHLSDEHLGHKTPAPFHPTPEGQIAIARAVLAKVQHMLGLPVTPVALAPAPGVTLGANGVTTSAGASFSGRVSGLPAEDSLSATLLSSPFRTTSTLTTGLDLSFTTTIPSGTPSGPSQLAVADGRTKQTAIIPIFIPYR